MKIRKVKQTKSNVMVQNLKDSVSAAAHLWTEYNSEKKMKVINECHLLQFAPFIKTYITPTKRINWRKPKSLANIIIWLVHNM